MSQKERPRLNTDSDGTRRYGQPYLGKINGTNHPMKAIGYYAFRRGFPQKREENHGERQGNPKNILLRIFLETGRAGKRVDLLKKAVRKKQSQEKGKTQKRTRLPQRERQEVLGGSTGGGPGESG